MVKFNPVSSFKLNYDGLESLMLHTKARRIGPPLLEKKNFEVFFTKYGHGCHLDHVTSTILINFHNIASESLNAKFG